MAEGVALQLDLGNLPSNALSLASSGHALLKAVSADNTNPSAVIQIQALGACFLSNGPWAAKLPDLLLRTPSMRLERLSAWIGWERGDTAAYMNQSSGGRTASLICLALGNLYKKQRCGMILYELSQKLLPIEQQNASVDQLSHVNLCLERKLDCLGFGNLLAQQLTRLRLCYFEVGSSIPTDFADTPTAETMQEFLICLQQALQDERAILHYCGTKGAGPLISVALCLCPEDVQIEVEGEIIQQGLRNSVIFSIRNGERHGSSFHVELKIASRSDEFLIQHIHTQPQNDGNENLMFSWTGFLSCHLDIAFARVGASPSTEIYESIANLIASVAQSLTGKDWCSNNPSARKENPIATDGLRTLLGPNYRRIIRESLRESLAEPTNDERPAANYEGLQKAVAFCLPITRCICDFCKSFNPWDFDKPARAGSSAAKRRNSCPVAQLWAQIGSVIGTGISSLLVKPASNISIRYQSHHWRHGDFLRSISKYLSIGQDKGGPTFTGAGSFHRAVLSLVSGPQHNIYLPEEERPPSLICDSFDSVTVFPVSLQYPCINNSWTIQYSLLDGMLHFGSDCYRGIVCAESHTNLQRPTALKGLLPAPARIVPSGLGEHNVFTMALRPDLVGELQYLVLRSTIQTSTKTSHVNFLNSHLGFMGLSPAEECEHSPRTSLEQTDGGIPILATSVMSPIPKRKDGIGLSLTHNNEEAQFLSCEAGTTALYQGNCCMSCAIEQARNRAIRMVIGGSASY